MGKAIIDDVAALAGVSIKTVSRVMNQEPNVRQSTRDKVLAAAKELNYRPNHSARGLAGSRSYLLALLYDNPSPSYLEKVQTGVLEVCQEQGYTMVLKPLDVASPTLLAELGDFIDASRVDGLILTPPVCDRSDLLEALASRGIPHVSIAPPDTETGLCITLDDQRAAREMTDYLIALGHTRIGFIKGNPQHGAANRRYDGYCEALENVGIAIDPALVQVGDFSFEAGLECAKNLLSVANPPTAIFAGNDDMAGAVINVAFEQGLAVPSDLSVTGFDDTPLSRQMWPAITTVRQPVRNMGHTACQTLLDHLQGETVKPVTNFPFELMIRRSSSARK